MANVSAVLATASPDSPADDAVGESPHALYLVLSLAALITILSGFAPSFFLRPWRAASPLAPAVVAHGIAFTSWVGLFLVQAMLVASGRASLHRRLGVTTAALAALMVASAVPLALSAAGRGAIPGDPLAFLLVMLVDLLAFGGFVSAAIHYRDRTEIHKRLMVLALASLLPPAVSRWPVAIRYPAVIPGVLLLFVAAPPVCDLWTRRRPNAVSLWGGLSLLASVPLRFAIARTEPWHALAGWIIRSTMPYGPR
jgi:hypothetical protein